MKIRIKENTIRIRCSSDEISKIASGETVVNTTVFSPLDRLVFSISKWNLRVIGVELKDGSTHISIPSDLLNNWSSTNEFSFEGNIENGHEKGLRVLIEVDLPCEHK